MNASAVICEYNPFHNGHKYQLENVKNQLKNPVVAIMSGSFTQRGDVAILDKFSRADLALKNGADLVIELPTVYALSSAEGFAKAGVGIADKSGCIDSLCFGAETDDLELLKAVADIFENNDFQDKIKEFMNSGDYYPVAVNKAMDCLYPRKYSNTLATPNNILAVEYLKALKGTEIKPFVTKRIGAGHDSDDCFENITSAGNIRNMMLKGKDYGRFIPYSLENEDFADIKRLEKVALYKLRAMSAEDFAKLPDVSEGLENRICEAVRRSCSIEELFESIKTKRYTMARIRRIVMCALLGITKELSDTPVPYIRVLGFNDNGREVLSQMGKACKVPLITNVSDGYKMLHGTAKRIFEIDMLATDIHSLATRNIKPCGRDFRNNICKK